MNNKSINERLNSVNDKGPDKWLSRDLFEDEEQIAQDLPDVIRHVKGKRTMKGVGAAKKRLKGQGFNIPGALKGREKIYPPKGWEGGVEIPDDMRLKRGEENPQELPDGVTTTPKNQSYSQLKAAGAYDRDETEPVKEPVKSAPKLKLAKAVKKAKAAKVINPEITLPMPGGRGYKLDADAVHPDQTLDEITGKSKSVNSASSKSRPDMAGRSVQEERDENATLEAIHAMINMGLDGEELEDRVGRHFQRKIGGGGKIDREYTGDERKDAMFSALESARRILGHFDEGYGDEVAMGSLGSGISAGGQNTDIPDESRSSLLDDMFRHMISAIGDKEDDYEGGPMQLLQDRMFGEGAKAGNFKDNLWPADIFLTKKDKEEEMMNQFNELRAIYQQDEDGIISPQAFASMFGELLSTFQNNKSAVGYSLKKLNPKAKGTHLYDFNTNPELPAKIIASMLTGKLKLPTAFNKNKAGQLGGAKGFNFNQMTKMLSNPDDKESLYKANPQYASMLANKPNYFKVEPVDNPRFGMTPTAFLRNLVKERTGEDIGFNTNEVPGSSSEQAINANNFDEEQIKYWQDDIQNLVDEPSKRFDISKQDFTWDGEKMAPKDWVKEMLTSFNLSDEEKEQDEDMIKRKGGSWDRKKQRMDVFSMLKNFRMFKMFRDAEKNGDMTDVLGKLIAGAGKINTDVDDPFYPFTKVVSGE